MVMATASLVVQYWGGDDDSSGSDSDDEQKRASLGSRKKGSTDMVKLDYQKSEEKGAKGNNIQVRKGAYAMILDEVSLVFQIERE
jgi:hypothetical protein